MSGLSNEPDKHRPPWSLSADEQFLMMLKEKMTVSILFPYKKAPMARPWLWPQPGPGPGPSKSEGGAEAHGDDSEYGQTPGGRAESAVIIASMYHHRDY